MSIAIPKFNNNNTSKVLVNRVSSFNGRYLTPQIYFPQKILDKPTNTRLESLDPRDWLRDYFLFAPSKKISEVKLKEGVKLEEVFINTQDGEKLHGYFMPASVRVGSVRVGLKPTPNKVILYLHGNDENVSRWYLGPANLQEHISVNALIMDYRGYGKSTGSPSGQGVIKDALAMYKYLIDKGYKPDDISLYGRSLGGAVALELATRVKVKSVIIQSSFTSLRDLMKFQYPSVPSFLMKNNLFNSQENIKKIKVPVLISHGTDDDIVPVHHGNELYKAANTPKELIVLKGAGHKHLKSFFTEEYFQALKRLLL